MAALVHMIAVTTATATAGHENGRSEKLKGASVEYKLVIACFRGPGDTLRVLQTPRKNSHGIRTTTSTIEIAHPINSREADHVQQMPM